MLIKLLSCAVVAFSLIGCDQIRTGINDSINPPTPQQVAKTVDELVSEGKYDAAIEKGRSFLAKHQDAGGAVAAALRQAYLKAGVSSNEQQPRKTDDQGVGQISSSKTITSITEVKQGSTVGGANNQSSSSQQTQSVSAGGASVIQGPSGTVVRAGDAVVVMPK